MGTFSPPWPQALIEPMEYQAFWRVPGPQKAKSQQIPPILGKKRKWGFSAFVPKMMMFWWFPAFWCPGTPEKASYSTGSIRV